MTRILVLGNDPQINQIRFDLLAPDVITLGVNRIWLKHIPNYFFFTDVPILNELNRVPNTLAAIQKKSFTYSSDWMQYLFKKSKIPLPNWVKIYSRRNRGSPDSVSNSIQLFNQMSLIKGPYAFYVAGVSLKWQSPSHFWQELNYPAFHKPSQEWYSPRFNKMYSNFQVLRQIGLNIVSVHPNSRLNNLFRYENIRTLYRRSGSH